ncbi:MAG: hypothetical protein AABO41_24135 [Acidobacteriota bacterium]
MISRTRNSSKAHDARVQGEPPQRGSNSNNDAGADQRARKDAWTDGFLTSTGAQMPLFVRPATRFKLP